MSFSLSLLGTTCSPSIEQDCDVRVSGTFTEKELKDFLEHYLLYETSLCHWTQFLQDKAIEFIKPNKPSRFELNCSISRVNDLFRIALKFYVPREKIIPDNHCECERNGSKHLHAVFGKILHASVKAECESLKGSHLLACNWKYLQGSDSLKLKANVLDSLLHPYLKKVEETCKTAYELFGYFFTDLPETTLETVTCTFRPRKQVENAVPLQNKEINIALSTTESQTIIHSECTNQKKMNKKIDLSHKYKESSPKKFDPVAQLPKIEPLVMKEAGVRASQNVKSICVEQVKDEQERQLEEPIALSVIDVPVTLRNELKNIHKFGMLRGRVTSLLSRKLCFDTKNEYSGSLPLDILFQIANCFLSQILDPSSSHEEITVARESLTAFQSVSRDWFSACTDLVAPHQKIHLPEDFIAGTGRFPEEILTSIWHFAEGENPAIGILYLGSHLLRVTKPLSDAQASALPSFPGYQVIYDTDVPLKYPYVFPEIEYFSHPKFSWATTLIDFISWPLIENFALLYVEDPFKRPALAMPYTWTESGLEGKGIFTLQFVTADNNGHDHKAWWVWIDKPIKPGESKAKVTCLLADYVDGGPILEQNTIIYKSYFAWLNNFLSGEICQDLPASKEGFDKATPSVRRVRHFNGKCSQKV